MSIGLAIIAVGAVIFIPAANERNFSIFLIGLFVQGMGMSLMQTAVNPYVTILGPIESAAKRISIMGICNKVAGALGPLILGSIVLKGIDQIQASLVTMNEAEKVAQLNSLAERVINPYLIMSIGLIILAVFVRFSPLPEIDTPEDEPVTPGGSARKSIFDFPHLFLGVFALFLYVGAEVIAGDTIIAYGQALNIPMDNAKFFTSLTLICMVLGYLLGIALIPKYMKQEAALRFSAILGVILTFAIIFTDGYVSVVCVALLGLANAIVWPAIWPLALNKVGSFTKTASALLIMAIAGGAILPLIYGWIADVTGSSKQAYWILLPCYAFILYYAAAGYKAGLNKK